MSRGRPEGGSDERTCEMDEVIVELDERVTILRGLSEGNWSRKEAKVFPILLPDWRLVSPNSVMAAQTCLIKSSDRALVLVSRERRFSIMSRLDKTTLRMGAPMLSRPFFQRCHAANRTFFHHSVASFVAIRGITSRYMFSALAASSLAPLPWSSCSALSPAARTPPASLPRSMSNQTRLRLSFSRGTP